MDGGNQIDFNRLNLPYVMEQVNCWLRMGAVEEVPTQPACVSPVILIPNQHKEGYRLCHDLRILNSTVVRMWGPSMNRYARIQDIPSAQVMSSFDLTKGFCRCPYQRQSKSTLGFM